MNAFVLKLLPIAALAVAAGCATDASQARPGYPLSPALKAKEPVAIEAALKRARADLACPAATAKVVSAQRLKPNFPGPRVQSPDRGEFGVEATGCGRRQALRVICAEDTTDCYVGDAVTR
jgi:hypothetical protein